MFHILQGDLVGTIQDIFLTGMNRMYLTFGGESGASKAIMPALIADARSELRFDEVLRHRGDSLVLDSSLFVRKAAGIYDGDIVSLHRASASMDGRSPLFFLSRNFRASKVEILDSSLNCVSRLNFQPISLDARTRQPSPMFTLRQSIFLVGF